MAQAGLQARLLQGPLFLGSASAQAGSRVGEVDALLRQSAVGCKSRTACLAKSTHQGASSNLGPQKVAGSAETLFKVDERPTVKRRAVAVAVAPTAETQQEMTEGECHEADPTQWAPCSPPPLSLFVDEFSVHYKSICGLYVHVFNNKAAALCTDILQWNVSFQLCARALMLS